MSAYDWHVNKTFDAFNQTFTVLGPDGVTPVMVQLSFLRELQHIAIDGGICQGTQIGAASILLICLFLITKTDKRRSLVFMLNATALLLVILRGIFSCITYTGAFYNWYRLQTYYYVNIGPAKAVSIAGELFDFLLVVVLELSLVLQVRIVCCTLEPRWRNTVNLFNSFVALLEISARFALVVLSIDWNIVHLEQELAWQFERLGKLSSATNILLVISIAISAAIFCAKLGFAIQARRSMGMTQFGPMQIIFVMGCQTMVTPLIFIMLAYFGFKSTNVETFVPTVVALSLPLSAMWAAAKTNHVHIAKPDRRHHHAIPVGLASAKAYGVTVTDGSDTLIDDDSTTLTSTSKWGPLGGSPKPDVEMQKFGDGVHVDRTYSVRSD